MSANTQAKFLLARWEELRVQGQEPTLEELCRDFPGLLDEVQQKIAAIKAVEDRSFDATTIGNGALPDGPGLESLPGYDLLDVLGRGGMGVVYCARHLALKRLVALKMILGGEHARPEDRDRFQKEVEAVARLQHPNIVQIYEVGQHQGLPYCALELVQGGTLATFLAGHPQPPRAAAQLAQQLALAVHYAHQRGIVHRDLKPSNILLQWPTTENHSGAAGSQSQDLTSFIPKITDFGLAKNLEQNDGQTRHGAIVGTPSYMAPEQASGDSRRVGPAADVYALGAVLYELLTGRPPFRAANLLDTVQQVLHQEPVPPARLQPKLPRDLETICLTCLHKEPAQRYAGADALAEDLRRFLAHESIKARPIGPWERLRKWVRRRPAAAALVAVSALGLLGLVVLWVWFTFNLRDERDIAQKESQRAEANFRRALQAVDQMLSEVGEEQLAHEPHMELKRRALLEKALAFYQDFLREKSEDREVRKKTGLAYKRVADLQRLLGQFADAEQSYQQAIALLEDLARDLPDAEFRDNLADSFNWQGELLRQASQPGPAQASLEKALDLQGRLVEENPEQPAYQRKLARTHMNLGLVFKDTNRPTQAIAAISQAIERLEQLPDKTPAVRQELARCHLNVGPLWRVAGEEGKAAAAYDRALTILKDLVEAFPRLPDYRLEWAVASLNLGNFTARKRQGAPAANYSLAEQHLNNAIDELAKLGADFPSVPLYRHERANARNSLGGLLVQKKDYAAARAAWSAARNDLEILTAEHLATTAYQGDLGMTRGNLGWLCPRDKQWVEARDHLKVAIPLVQAALAPNPNNPDYLQTLRSQYRDLTRAHVNLQDHAEAAKVADRLAQSPLGAKEDYYQAAQVVGRCCQLVQADSALAAADRQRLLQTYRRQAIKLLDQALERGFQNTKQLQTDEAFQDLRDHPDFVDLLAKYRKP